jgi:hypothetical protein
MTRLKQKQIVDQLLLPHNSFLEIKDDEVYFFIYLIFLK